MRRLNRKNIALESVVIKELGKLAAVGSLTVFQEIVTLFCQMIRDYTLESKQLEVYDYLFCYWITATFCSNTY